MTVINQTLPNYSTPPSQNKVSQTEKSAAEVFLEYMDKTPEERMFEQILKELGLTKEQYERLTPEERKKVDKKIEEKMKEMMTRKEKL